MIQKIITDNNLTCTVAQFTTYMNWLKINTSIYNKLMPTKCLFSKKYNWHIIENPAKWKYYYYITVWWQTFLQNSAPYVQWLVWLNDKNIDKIILEHKTKLINDFIELEKLKLTINNFKNK